MAPTRSCCKPCSNLIVNAEQALQGVPEGAITLEVTERSGEAVLRVIDNGRGLDHGIADRAFEPFVTTHPVPDASGLGLTRHEPSPIATAASSRSIQALRDAARRSGCRSRMELIAEAES